MVAKELLPNRGGADAGSGRCGGGVRAAVDAGARARGARGRVLGDRPPRHQPDTPHGACERGARTTSACAARATTSTTSTPCMGTRGFLRVDLPLRLQVRRNFPVLGNIRYAFETMCVARGGSGSSGRWQQWRAPLGRPTRALRTLTHHVLRATSPADARSLRRRRRPEIRQYFIESTRPRAHAAAALHCSRCAAR